MIQWIEKNTAWQYVLRTSPQMNVQTDQQEQAIRDNLLEKGKVLFLPQAGFTQTLATTLNVVGWWPSRYEEPIFMVTNLDSPYKVCRYYRRWLRIETCFSDQKSRGFHIHKSHLVDPARLSRLLIAACLVYIWVITQGLQVIATNNISLIDRTERIDKSLFRLGLDWLKYALKRTSILSHCAGFNHLF